MTWEELTDLLSELAEQFETKVNINRMVGLETVMLHLVPVAYFCSMKFTGELIVGMYEGKENRLVGKENFPLAELTPEFVRRRVGDAAREWWVHHMDFEVVREMMQNLSLEKLSRHPLRDVEGAG